MSEEQVRRLPLRLPHRHACSPRRPCQAGHCHLDFWVKEIDQHGDDGEKAKKLKWGTPYGRELHNLLRSLDLHALLPSRATTIRAVWQGFLDLHALLDSDHLFAPEEIVEFKARAKGWVLQLTKESLGSHSDGVERGMYQGV